MPDTSFKLQVNGKIETVDLGHDPTPDEVKGIYDDLSTTGKGAPSMPDTLKGAITKAGSKANTASLGVVPPFNPFGKGANIAATAKGLPAASTLPKGKAATGSIPTTNLAGTAGAATSAAFGNPSALISSVAGKQSTVKAPIPKTPIEALNMMPHGGMATPGSIKTPPHIRAATPQEANDLARGRFAAEPVDEGPYGRAVRRMVERVVDPAAARLHSDQDAQYQAWKATHPNSLSDFERAAMGANQATEALTGAISPALGPLGRFLGSAVDAANPYHWIAQHYLGQDPANMADVGQKQLPALMAGALTYPVHLAAETVALGDANTPIGTKVGAGANLGLGMSAALHGPGFKPSPGAVESVPPFDLTGPSAQEPYLPPEPSVTFRPKKVAPPSAPSPRIPLGAKPYEETNPITRPAKGPEAVAPASPRKEGPIGANAEAEGANARANAAHAKEVPIVGKKKPPPGIAPTETSTGARKAQIAAMRKEAVLPALSDQPKAPGYIKRTEAEGAANYTFENGRKIAHDALNGKPPVDAESQGISFAHVKATKQALKEARQRLAANSEDVAAKDAWSEAFHNFNQATEAHNLIRQESGRSVVIGKMGEPIDWADAEDVAAQASINKKSAKRGDLTRFEQGQAENYAAKVAEKDARISELERKFEAHQATKTTRAGSGAKSAEPEIVTFKTEKGSTYEVNKNGTTTRNKAARPEHPGDEGLKPTSQYTVYVDDAGLNNLGEFQAQGSKKRLVRISDGTVGIQYLEGPNAGKIGRRTVTSPKSSPSIGLYPVEVWNDGSSVHFGNKITEMGFNTGTKSGGSKLPTDIEGLRAHFEKRVQSGSLYQEPRVGGKQSGAVSTGARPRFTTDEAAAIWKHAKTNYIDPSALTGEPRMPFNKIVNNVASDLGLSADDVRHAFAADKTSREITDQMWRAASERRTVVKQAEGWVNGMQMSPLKKGIKTVANIPRGTAVFGHANPMITHAGPQLFQPKNWKTWGHSFVDQFKAFASPEHHERLMQDMESSPYYAQGLRSKLKIGSGYHDDYTVYQNVLGNLAKKVHGKTGDVLSFIPEGGSRAMDVLKSYRMQRFAQEMEKLPVSMRKEAAPIVADWINHATGAGSMGHGTIIELAKEGMFAPSLEASRWARMVGDPVKVARDFAFGSPAAKRVAKTRLKMAGSLVGTYMGALAVNHALQVATGQKDQVNWLDPSSSDWLKFKWSGKTYDPTGNLTAPFRYLSGVIKTIAEGPIEAFGERNRLDAIGKNSIFYGRGKLAPQYGIAADALASSDMVGRPMPWASEKEKRSSAEKGKPAYSWGEYAATHGPIPASEAIRSMYDSMREEGLSELDANAIIKGIIDGVIGATGTKVGKSPKKYSGNPPAKKETKKELGAPPGIKGPPKGFKSAP